MAGLARVVCDKHSCKKNTDGICYSPKMPTLITPPEIGVEDPSGREILAANDTYMQCMDYEGGLPCE